MISSHQIDSNIEENKNHTNDQATFNFVDILDENYPRGWSYICFDETINYYIKCNTNNLESKL